MARNPIDSINQAESIAAQTGVGKVDKAIGIGKGLVDDLVLIGGAALGGFAAGQAIRDVTASGKALGERAMEVINANGSNEDLQAARAIQNEVSTETAKAAKLNALANKTLRTSDPTRSEGSSATGSTSAEKITKAPAGAGRQYNYTGPCPTMTTGGKDRLARDGSRCGRRAASVRPGGWWV